MGLPARGDLVVLKFPFSDLSAAKLRPGLVIGEAGNGDLIICQLTSRNYHEDAIEIDPALDVRCGKLRTVSYARPLKLFTANACVIEGAIGSLSDTKLALVIQTILAAIDPR
jgi:mRNA interferase MazF